MTMTTITVQRTDQQALCPPQRLDAGLDQGGLMVTWGVAGTRMHQPTADGAAQSGTVPRLTPDEITTILSVAARAPSTHNTQPWQFRPGDNYIELLADPDRMLRAVDPDSRELMISCGAALFGLRLGLRRVGRLPAVEPLPDRAQPWLAARVWSAGHAARTQVEADLIAAVPHRHTHRGSFSPGEVPSRLLNSMVTDAIAEGCELMLINDAKTIDRLHRLVRRAAAQQQADPDIMAELARWVRPLHSQARDGVPATARLAASISVSQRGNKDEVAAGRQMARPRPAATVPGRLPGRDFGLPGTEEQGAQPPSATAVLLTARDTAADWLRAGQALDRVLLRAAGRWVFASLQSQPLESPRHRHAVRALLGGHGYPQMVLQFGRANTTIATPRRSYAEMLAPEQPN
jgi:hypothetical protein